MEQKHLLPPRGAVLREALIDGDTIKDERRVPFPHVVSAGMASVITMCVALVMLDLERVPYLLASLGGSCVILFGIPDNVMAQPRSFIGGHFVGTTVGLIFSHSFSVGIFTTACAVGTAIALMMVTDTIHSPAGADPLIVMAAHPGWSFLAAPLALGLAILFVAATLYHRLVLRRVYPIRWL
jgi:CBS-domain-containing membrane protein